MTVINLLREQLGLGTISTMVAGFFHNENTIYFGRIQSYEHDRMNLGVLRAGKVTYFKDCTQKLALPNKSSVIKIVLSPFLIPTTLLPHRKLYLIAATDLFSNDEQEYLSIYDLDSNGYPIASSLASFALRDWIGKPIYSLALKPEANIPPASQPKLYLGGSDPGAVWVWDLDLGGNPTPGLTRVPNIGQVGKYDLAVNPNGTLLYMGSYGSGSETPMMDVGPLLEVVTLDSSTGYPTNTGYRSYNFGTSYADGPLRSNTIWPPETDSFDPYLQFHYTPNAIYRRRTSMRTFSQHPAELWPIIAWPLGANGYPISPPAGGRPLPYSTRYNLPTPYDDPYLGFAESIDPQTNQIWIATVNTFPDVFPPHQLCISGVTLARYNLDQTTWLPTGGPVDPPAPAGSTLPIDMQYGYLVSTSLDRFGNTVVELLTQLGSDAHHGYAAFNDIFIGNSIKDLWMVLKIDSTPPPTNDSFPVQIKIVYPSLPASRNPPPFTPNPLPRNTRSDPLLLDEYLKADSSYFGPCVFAIAVAPMGYTDYTTNFDNLKVTVDIYKGHPPPVSPPPPFKSIIIDNVKGNRVLFVIPTYNFLAADELPFVPDSDPQKYHHRKAQIQSYRDYVSQFLQGPPVPGPVDRFIISAYSTRGFQGDLVQLQTEAETLAKLGINTAMTAPDPAGVPAEPYYEWPGDHPAPPPFASEIQRVLDNTGLIWRSAATGAVGPDSFFNFIPPNIPISNWVNLLKTSYNRSLEKLVNFQLGDEPGWEYGTGNPATDRLVVVNTSYLQNFRDYLRTLPQGFQPSYFATGATSWNDMNIKAIGGGSVTSSPETRHLFFWTMRFFAESASKGACKIRDALKAASQTQTTNIYFNLAVPSTFFSKFDLGSWYTGRLGSDAAKAGMDWFTAGRLNAHTLWTEDEFLDQEAQFWSFAGDGLRSAATLAPNYGNSSPLPGEPGGIGGYIKGYRLAGNRNLGGHPAGASYKILALIGHGAKAIDIFSYGPYPIGGNPWSQIQTVYQPIADALGLVGRAERLLFPGRPRRGNVAIYLPGISNLWDPDSYYVLYQNEVRYLHYALIHAGYTVDFVDDYDLAGGALQQRGYTTLYVTGPNVANDTNMTKGWYLYTASDISVSTQPYPAVLNITLPQAIGTNTGDVLTYNIVTQPSNQDPNHPLAASGQTVTYTPSMGFAGPDSFTYKVTDSYGATSNTATVTITVTTEAITAYNISASTQPNPAELRITLQAIDTNAGAVLTYHIVTQPSHNDGILAPQSPPLQQTVIYRPLPGFTGPDSFQYNVTDNTGATSNMATVTIDVTTTPSNPSAQQQISLWVEQGGVLAVTPGGGVADEYNYPTSIFDTVLGVNPNSREANRDTILSAQFGGNERNHSFNMFDTITITDSRFGIGAMDLSTPVTELHFPATNSTATTVASFSNGNRAITINKYGKGYGIVYAFFPGFHYQQSANWDSISTNYEPSQGTVLPYGWGKIQRDIIVAPAKIANTQKPITLTQNGKILEMVEACLLESEKGIAIVLLNWSDMPNHVPIINLTITINNSTTNIPVGSPIYSSQLSPPRNLIGHTSSQPPFSITLPPALPLDYVDIITIEA